jgi:hypothetical protein
MKFTNLVDQFQLYESHFEAYICKLVGNVKANDSHWTSLENKPPFKKLSTKKLLVESKGKVVPVLNKVPHHEDIYCV